MYRSGKPVHPIPGLPGDFVQHADQCVHILFVIFDAETHQDETGLNGAGESRSQDQSQVSQTRPQRTHFEQMLDQQMGAKAALSHTDPALLG